MANSFDGVSIWQQTVIQSFMYLARLLCQPEKIYGKILNMEVTFIMHCVLLQALRRASGNDNIILM